MVSSCYRGFCFVFFFEGGGGGVLVFSSPTNMHVDIDPVYLFNFVLF